MGRAKVKLEPIAKERSRNTTFQKRKKGLKKKTYEFSTLCGVDTCLIIFGPKQGDGFVEPETWPENREDVLNIIDKFKKHSRDEQGKRQVGLPHFFEDQTKKLHSELIKLRHSNSKAKYPTWDERIHNFSEIQLRNLAATLNSKLELLNLQIDLIEANQYQSASNDVTSLIEYSVPPLNQYLPLPPPPPPPPLYWDSSMDGNRYGLSIDYVPSVPSLIFPTTMVNDGMDCKGDRYGESSSIIPHNPANVVAPMSNPNSIYYNPTLPTFDEMGVVNNTGGGPLPCYFSPNMQPMMHSYFAPQLHPIDEFSDLHDY